MSQQNRVLAIVYQSANNVLLASTQAFTAGLTALGYRVDILDLQREENFRRMFELLQSGEVAFGLGLQGVGSQLHAGEQNLWHAARTPFVSLHYDHPSYCIGNHLGDSPFVGNMYHYQSMKTIFDKYIFPLRPFPRLSSCVMSNCFPISDAPDDFDDRPIRFLYLKTGVSLDEYEQHFNSLPTPLRDGVWDRIREAEKNPNLSLCDLAASLFDQATFFLPDTQVEFWAIVKGMDLYLRGKRAIDMVEWLKHQEGAVIIGNGWDAIDKTGARATFKPSLDANPAAQLYAQTQIICNTNPYADDLVHERVILGLISRCAVLTDTNAWLDTRMGDVPNLIRFDWSEPLNTQIMPRLSDLSVFKRGGEESRQKTATLFKNPDNAEKVAAFAQKIRANGEG